MKHLPNRKGYRFYEFDLRSEPQATAEERHNFDRLSDQSVPMCGHMHMYRYAYFQCHFVLQSQHFGKDIFWRLYVD